MKEALQYSGKTSPKILLVDDKKENILAIQKTLNGLDVETVVADNGNDALKHTLNHEFALALLDVQMPGMDGYELAELLRSDELTSDIPIIFISAIFTDKLNIFKGYEKGAFSFITKPFEPLELINKVRFFVEKYHTTKAFNESRVRFMTLYNSSPDMLISVDIEKETIVECNNTFCKNTGYTKNEVIGKTVYFFYSHHSVEKVKKAFAVFKKQGAVENIELSLKHKSGELIEVLFNATGIKDLDGKIIQSNTSLRDISELKKAKKKLEAALEELKRTNKDLETFVYLTSHDLQEPMLTVKSFINLIEEEYSVQLDDEGRNYLKYCSQAADRLKELITCLLNYLRIGQQKNIECIDINSIMNEVILELSSQINQVSAKVIYNNLPQINTCRNDIKLLFKNLVENAIKYRKEGTSPNINITAEEKETGWEFLVADNGIGINKKYFDKAFQMFQQLHERGKYEGLGVGLTTCKKIVEHYGGKIWVESVENEYSKFYFTLPF
jgi:PAS domain S-box-containing protein